MFILVDMTLDLSPHNWQPFSILLALPKGSINTYTMMQAALITFHLLELPWPL
jgi:hypothetical protein